MVQVQLTEERHAELLAELEQARKDADDFRRLYVAAVSVARRVRPEWRAADFMAEVFKLRDRIEAGEARKRADELAAMAGRGTAKGATA